MRKEEMFMFFCVRPLTDVSRDSKGKYGGLDLRCHK